MANRAEHLSDDDFAELDDDASTSLRVHEHLQACHTCREHCEELTRLRELLSETGHRERRPMRDVVPSAMMRLRLRRHGVSNANELLEGIAILVRGLASLFSLPTPEQRFAGGTSGTQDGEHE